MLKLIYSLIVLVFFTFLPLIILGKQQQIESSQWLTITENPLFQFFFVVDYQIEAWHITRFVAAILSVSLYLYADSLLVAREDSPKQGLNHAPTILNLLSRLRTPFALFTIGCALYLMEQSIDWQSLSIQWLPPS